MKKHLIRFATGSITLSLLFGGIFILLYLANHVNPELFKEIGLVDYIFVIFSSYFFGYLNEMIYTGEMKMLIKQLKES